MARACCCSQAGGRFMQHTCEPSSRLSASRPACRMPMPRRPAVQCDRVTVSATVLRFVDSAPLFARSNMDKFLKADELHAIVSASGASSSTEKKLVARRQLDQLFETLSTKHSIMTAQCLSHDEYKKFEAQMLGAGSEAIGCCYFAGQEAECLAVNGYVELIYGAFDYEDDNANQTMADIICKTAQACNLLIEKEDDDPFEPGLKLFGFDPMEFAEWRTGCIWENEYDDEIFLMHKKY